MWKEVKDQERDKTVKNSTAEMLLQSLERMSHDWCDPRYNKVSKEKTKRSFSAILATLFAFGSLIIGPAIAAVLEEISHNTKWRITEAKRGLETAKILAEFEKRLSANERVEEILASIMLHESILRDLMLHSDDNRTWKKIFKHQIREYKELGFIDEIEEIELGRKDNLLPKGSYKFVSSVHKNKDCGETMITIKAIGLIPEKTCFHLHWNNEPDEDYIRLQSSIDNLCIFAGNDSISLPGNQTFLTSNTIRGPCDNKNKFIFKSKENTLLVRPVSSRGYMTSKCGEKYTRQILYRDQYYVLPLKCKSWVSNKKRRRANVKTDYFQTEETFLSATTGREIEYQETEPTLIFYAIEAVKDLETKNVEITKVDKNYVENFIDEFVNAEREREIKKMDKTKTKIVAILSGILLMLVALIILWKICKKTEFKPRTVVGYIRGEKEVSAIQVEIPRKETLEGNQSGYQEEENKDWEKNHRRKGIGRAQDQKEEQTEVSEQETISLLPKKVTFRKPTHEELNVLEANQGNTETHEEPKRNHTTTSEKEEPADDTKNQNSGNTLKRQDSDVNITTEPIYAVPRIRYNNKAKKHQERAGMVEVNTYSDDLAGLWGMPTVENKTQGMITRLEDKTTADILNGEEQEANIAAPDMITRLEDKTTADIVNGEEQEANIAAPDTKQPIQKETDGSSQEMLHEKLLNELHARFLVMEAEHNLK